MKSEGIKDAGGYKKQKTEDTRKQPHKKLTEPKPAWLKKDIEPAKADMNTPKKWGEYPYYWCCPATGGKCDGRWRRHTPKSCEGTGKPKDAKARNKEKQVRIKEAVVELDGGYES